MSQQDKALNIVVNHQTIKQVVDWLLVPELFTGMRTREGARWKPRMLAVAALLWACSDLATLKDRFTQSQKIVKRVFRWQPAPGQTCEGFMKMLRKWHVELILVIQPHVRGRVALELIGVPRDPEESLPAEVAVIGIEPCTAFLLRGLQDRIQRWCPEPSDRSRLQRRRPIAHHNPTTAPARERLSEPHRRLRRPVRVTHGSHANASSSATSGQHTSAVRRVALTHGIPRSASG